MSNVTFPIWNTVGMLDTAHLHVFVRIVDAGNLSAAARSLGMPKSSVSRTLGRLETAAGSPLLERTPRHLRLTDAGRLLLRHARRILDEVAEAETALGGLVGEPAGDLSVAAPATFAAGPLAAMLPAFMDRYPKVRVRLLLVTTPVDLLAEDVDVSIRMEPLPDSSLVARRLAGVPRWLCASPAYLASRSLVTELSDLVHHRLLHSHDGSQTLDARGPDGETAEVSVVPTLAAREPVVLVSLALAGAGIAILPSVYVRERVASGELVRLLPALDFGAVTIHALHTGHRGLSLRARVFLDALITHLADGEPAAFAPA